MAHISYKYKLLPSKRQEKSLSQMAGSTRWLWNYMLDLNQKQYAIDKKFIFGFNMNLLLPELKAQHIWLKDPPSQTLQQKCIDLDRALKSVWKSGFGFPKFKSKHKTKDSFRIPQTNGHIKISESHIKIPKLGEIKWKYHRSLTGILKSITISRDIDDWVVSVLCEIPDVALITDVDQSKTIGIDLGVAHFATLSDGTKIDSPNLLKKKLKYLKKYQRQLSKKTKGSNNRKKAAKRISKIHRYIRNQRSDWLHKISTTLVQKYDVICIEDLQIKKLIEKKQMSRAISDQGWGIFTGLLAQKATARGTHVTKIGTYMPSTKTCSACGTIRQMKLSDRVYICENNRCADYLKTKDRDWNAAINIHFWGLTATQNINLHTPGMGGINACGDTSAQDDDHFIEQHLGVSMNQEAVCPSGPQ